MEHIEKGDAVLARDWRGQNLEGARLARLSVATTSWSSGSVGRRSGRRPRESSENQRACLGQRPTWRDRVSTSSRSWFLPARIGSLASRFRALLWRHSLCPRLTALEAALATERDRGRILPCVRVDRLNLTRSLAHDLEGKLVHIDRAFAGALRHTPMVARPRGGIYATA